MISVDNTFLAFQFLILIFLLLEALLFMRWRNLQLIILYNLILILHTLRRNRMKRYLIGNPNIFSLSFHLLLRMINLEDIPCELGFTLYFRVVLPYSRCVLFLVLFLTLDTGFSHIKCTDSKLLFFLLKLFIAKCLFSAVGGHYWFFGGCVITGAFGE